MISLRPLFQIMLKNLNFYVERQIHLEITGIIFGMRQMTLRQAVTTSLMSLHGIQDNMEREVNIAVVRGIHIQ